MGLIDDLIQKEIGALGFTEGEDTVIPVGTTDEQILKADPDRLAILFINLESNPVWIKPGGRPATTTSGIRVPPTGGQIYTLYKEDLTLPSLEWHGIAETAENDILAIQFFGLKVPE